MAGSASSFPATADCGSGSRSSPTWRTRSARPRLRPERIEIVDPRFTYQGKPWLSSQSNKLLPPFTLEIERDLYYGRMDAARAFAAVHPINTIGGATGSAWLGIAAPGKTYYDVKEALATLGLDDAALQRYGIRLLRIGMLSPMEPSIVRRFADGLEEILVIEEKRSFAELFIRDILYNQAVRPRIAGKRDEQGRYLIPADRELDADRLVPILAARLRDRVPVPPVAPPPTPGAAADGPVAIPAVARQAYFCSGCPHNRSTAVPEGSLAGGGIGCHALVLAFRPETVGLTHMGGEGAQLIGMSPFSGIPHMFQNVGDGTFFHSGSMVVRQAVAAGTNITLKILYNSAVAMTGGQDAAGALPVPDLTRLLEAEGVRSIMVLAEQPHAYPRQARWAKSVRVWHRDRLDEAQRLLRETPGVTVLIYDQRCAAEKRRLRKRGRLAEPPKQVFINEAVCEGCGDCGVKSNCLSVHPVDTEFGRKTQIHQSLLQPRLHLPGGRLSVVRDDHRYRTARAQTRRRVPHRARAAAAAPIDRCPRREHLHDGDRRNRSRHRQSDSRHRRAARRQTGAWA